MKATRRGPKKSPVRISRAVIDFFLLEQARSLERFTQDGGVVADVWYQFGTSIAVPVRVLMAPCEGVSSVEVGQVLHQCILDYRQSPAAGKAKSIQTRRALSVSPLENFVAVELYLDELLRVVLPLTQWWDVPSRLNAARPDGGKPLQNILHDEILSLLDPEKPAPATGRDAHERKLREAAPVAALIGLFVLAINNPERLKDLPQDEEFPGSSTAFSESDRVQRFATIAYRMRDYAEPIARAAVAELARDIPDGILSPELTPESEDAAWANDPDGLSPPALIHRVFSDRKISLAVAEGICTIKADAAQRVFDISCRNITWAIIDSGIDARHPAFADHDPKRRDPSRIKAILDFTVIEKIRNFRLTEHEPGSPAHRAVIDEIIEALRGLPDHPYLRGAVFEETARVNLDLIGDQLRRRLQPDWALIEPLIRRRPADDAEPTPTSLVSSHGTHVAGILGADWRQTDGKDLKGVCPDIKLYDLRVIERTGPLSTEFAVLGALEYVQFANRRTVGLKQVIHGVNISLSIPHAVRTYACGATPICVACNNLVGSGVVVVAAAGNRGWNEHEIGFGNFVFCSITDPGNAEDVITVGATHRERPHTYGVSFFSSRGPTGDGRVKPDLVAPGEKINGPIPNDSSDHLDGTSMAAPFVSGAAAMLLARNTELTGKPRVIKQILRDSATDLGREKYFQGQGLLDVLRALQSV